MDTLQTLNEHATKIQNKEINKRIPSEVKGVKTKPVFTAIDVDHYVISILHILLGKANDVLKHLVEEIQAAAETYTTDYTKAEMELEKAKQKLNVAKDELTAHNTTTKEMVNEYKKI